MSIQCKMHMELSLAASALDYHYYVFVLVSTPVTKTVVYSPVYF